MHAAPPSPAPPWPLQRAGIRCFADIPRAYGRSTPDRPALIFDGRTTTWRQWDRRSNQAAHALRASLSAPQARFGYLAKNSDRFFELYMGAAKSGTVLVPVNWRLAAPEIAVILDDAQVEIVFVDREFHGLLRSIRRELPQMRNMVCIDATFEDCIDYESWRDAQPDTDPDPPSADDDVVIQMYTSGTTGLPKGVQISNRNLIANLGQVDTEANGRWSAQDVAIVPLPLFHAGGSTYGMYAPYAGGCVVLLREATASLILQAFRQHPVTKLGIVPALLAAILDHPDCAGTDFEHFDMLTYGGSPISADVLERGLRTLNCGFLQMFGMTESTTVGTVLSPEDHDPARPELLTSCGRPSSRTELRIVDFDGTDLPAMETGEILLRGDFITQGYWRRPEATAAAIRDGWYHSGDAGYLDEQGYLHVRDRLKDMIVSGGENVYPAEIESALSRHPGIADVAVIGVPDARWGEAVKAVIVPRAGFTLDAAEVIAFARTLIAGFKCPKSIDIVETLPRNPSGKLLKRVLREPYWKGMERQVG
jgi:long-chain acyl-CoA synthetase